MIKDKRPKCKNCSSELNVMPIKYGLPYNEDFDFIQKKQLMLGGFKYDNKSPNWYCKSCENKWKED